MAERRMFAKTIVESDAFMSMPTSAQALYFHLGMVADDDGFINGAKGIQRMCGASEDDLNLLFAKKFLLLFSSGVTCLKHWRINNYLQSDRKKPTIYTEELETLRIKPNKAYTLNENYPCIQNVYTGKDIAEGNVDKSNVEENNLVYWEDSKETSHEKKEKSSTEKLTFGYWENVRLTQSEYDSLKSMYRDADRLIETVSGYLKDSGKFYSWHYKLILKIAKEDGYEVMR